LESDYLIRNGVIVDGTGGDPFPADLAIEGSRIQAIGKLADNSAATVIDATGLVIAPGFIDIHTHADLEMMSNPRIESKLMQGVTTEVFSNCGLGFAPVASTHALAMQRKYLRGLFGDHPSISWDWTTTREFLECYRGRIATNIAYLVPHGALRVSAMGWQDRLATAEEVQIMNRLLHEAMDSGAFGLSTGLFYRPMNSAGIEECIELCKTIAHHDGLFGIHLRDYQRHLLKSLDESFTIARDSGVRLQVSHLQAPGKLHKGQRMGEQLMTRMESARRSGVDAMCDLYPYTAGCTMLASLLPSWVTAGEVSEAVALLREPSQRERIRAHIQGLDYMEFSGVFLCGLRPGKNRELEGKCLADIATQRNRSVADTMCELLAEEEMQIAYVVHQSSEEDLRVILQHPLLMIGSDAVHLDGQVHPRVFGTYPRVLSEYVRRERLLSLPDAVRKMSALPAERLALKDRGTVAVGLSADLVLFDPDTVQDNATYQQPKLYPSGIPYVFVNGTPVKDNHQHTGALPGQVLMR
jgi:N-acyl-D-amino-acid deacylase